MRLQRFEAGADADAAFELLPGHRLVAVAERILQPECETVHAELFGKLVIERLLADRCLRHAEAAEGAGDRPVGVDGAALGPVVRREIGPGRMHRHAVRHRRAEARIRPGVEVAVEGHADDLAVRIHADRRLHRGRMPLGGRDHRFMTRVGKCRRPAGLQRDQPDQRLQRHVDLGAETAAGRGRHDAHLFSAASRAPARCRRGPYAVPACRRKLPACRRPSARSRPPARYRRARHRRSRWCRSTTCVAPFSAASGSPRSTSPLVSTLPGRVSCSRTASAFSASHGSSVCGSSVHSIGKLREVETRHRRALARDQRDRLAAEAHEAFRQRRLVGERRDRAEAILSGNVGCRENRHDAGMAADVSVKIAKGKAG